MSTVANSQIKATSRVFIVQCPVGESFERIASTFPWSVASIGPTESTINWDDYDTSGIATIKESLYFVRHYAVFLIHNHVLINSELTIRERFESGCYWDHPETSSGKPAELMAGNSWDSNFIENIDAVQDVGNTDLSCDEISERHKTPFRFSLW
ncbi:hypothetical protein DPV78_011696 [Talaromyces pinophilus]|nr:hypothetical protein DPV78_011696 [Talaromyces pinophilus]